MRFDAFTYRLRRTFSLDLRYFLKWQAMAVHPKHPLDFFMQTKGISRPTKQSTIDGEGVDIHALLGPFLVMCLHFGPFPLFSPGSEE